MVNLTFFFILATVMLIFIFFFLLPLLESFKTNWGFIVLLLEQYGMGTKNCLVMTTWLRQRFLYSLVKASKTAVATGYAHNHIIFLSHCTTIITIFALL